MHVADWLSSVIAPELVLKTVLDVLDKNNSNTVSAISHDREEGA